MNNGREEEGKDLYKRLASLHFWNVLLVALLALTGLMLLSHYWRSVLGEARVWIKWLHIIIGLVSIVPMLAYLRDLTRHWKQLKDKF